MHCDVMFFQGVVMPVATNRIPKTTENHRPAKVAGVKRVKVKIVGKHPGILFQGKGVMEADQGSAKPPRRTALEEATLRAHWLGEGKYKQLCIPWVMLYNSICTSAGGFKFRGAKKMTSVIAATVTCEVDRIPLGTDKFDVYEDYVRIPPKTGAMVKIGRALLKEWSAEFVLIVDDELYDVANVKPIIEHAGNLIGIGAWRPERRGAYGRFSVEEFRVI
jgi:hypothetical protein